MGCKEGRLEVEGCKERRGEVYRDVRKAMGRCVYLRKGVGGEGL